MRDLKQVATTVRRHIVSMTHAARSSHVGSSLSCADILVSLYFDAAELGADPGETRPRDRIILSKGHAAPALYACLAERGIMDRSLLETYCCDGSQLGEHPCINTVPGIDCTSGSLGHGLGIGCGTAVGLRLKSLGGQVYVVMSDGECNEGSVWEAALWAPKKRLDNLTAVIDHNGFQACARIDEVTNLMPLAPKWREFGWEVFEVDGHDFEQLGSAFRSPRKGRPRMIIAKTVYAKGVSFMENVLEWHYRPPSDDDMRRAMEELKEGGA